MAIAIEFRQASDVLCALIDLKNVEFIKGYRSGGNWLPHRDRDL